MTTGEDPVASTRTVDFVIVAIAVALVLVSSIGIQLLHGLAVRVPLGLAVTVALLVSGSALRSRSTHRGSADTVLALGALSVFGWVSAIVTTIPSVGDWIASAPPAAAFLLVNSTKLSSVAVLMIVIIACRWSPKRLFITRGRLNGPTGIPRLGWAIAGPVVIVLVGVLFLTEPSVLENISGAAGLIDILTPVAPLLIAGPVVNAISEELLYRHAVIGTLLPVVGVRIALLTSSTIFGLGHLTGSPGGWTGVLFTFIYGLVSGLAMLQNRGMVWNTTIHTFADFAAISAITIASSAALS